jgi:DNA-binding response OmpR family regulator
MRSMSSEIVSAPQTILAVDSSDLLRRLGPEFLRSGFQLEVLASFSTHCLRAPRRPVAALVRCPHSLSLFARTCHEIREESPDIPLVVMCPRTDVETKVLLFEMGADDYVEEPFAVEELIARVRSIIRSRKHTGAKASGI